MFEEDTLLPAMENAGKEDFDKGTEKKGLGTPATRAGIIESLVSSGYVKLSVVPVSFKSPAMTAERENALLQRSRRGFFPQIRSSSGSRKWYGI